MSDPKPFEKTLRLSNTAFWAFATVAILGGVDWLFLDSQGLGWLRAEVGAPPLSGIDLHRRETYVLGLTGTAALLFHFASQAIVEEQKKK